MQFNAVVNKKNKYYKPGSVSLFVKNNISIIYLCDLPIVAFISEIRRAALYPQPIWPFNIRGLPNTIIANYACELLPHIFTITLSFHLRLLGFLWHSLLHNISAFVPILSNGELLFVARTFLH